MGTQQQWLDLSSQTTSGWFTITEVVWWRRQRLATQIKATCVSDSMCLSSQDIHQTTPPTCTLLSKVFTKQIRIQPCTCLPNWPCWGGLIFFSNCSTVIVWITLLLLKTTIHDFSSLTDFSLYFCDRSHKPNQHLNAQGVPQNHGHMKVCPQINLTIICIQLDTQES